jgi:hypothetical protein
MRAVATVAAVADFMRGMKRQNRDESQWISTPGDLPAAAPLFKSEALAPGQRLGAHHKS